MGLVFGVNYVQKKKPTKQMQPKPTERCAKAAGFEGLTESQGG